MFALNEMSCWTYSSQFAKVVEGGRDNDGADALASEAVRSPSLESWVDFDMKALTNEGGCKQGRPTPLHWMTKERNEACRREIDSLFNIGDDSDDVDVEIDETGNSAAPFVLTDTPLFRRLRSMDLSLGRAEKPVNDADRHGSSEFGEKSYSYPSGVDEIESNTERLVCTQIEGILSPSSSRDNFQLTAFSEDLSANLNILSQSLISIKHCDVGSCSNVIIGESLELLSEDESQSVFERTNCL